MPQSGISADVVTDTVCDTATIYGNMIQYLIPPGHMLSVIYWGSVLHGSAGDDIAGIPEAYENEA